jgi:transposase
MAARRSRPDPKAEALRRQSSLHRHPEAVQDELFRDGAFFDPRDLVQVKYEMLRRVEGERRSVSGAARTFGFSRPSFYQAQRAFHSEGLPGLLPKRRGPRTGHKLTESVLEFVEAERAADPALGTAVLVGRIEERFGVHVHPRSLERALARRAKKAR